ncbi:MAG TPA: HD domain-containing protein [Longimicrobium sp.]|jgi:2-amino-4-hydroxy-6-hydroxymethyldihydropteridine diphosphokinase|nr:HD domain-containing protein [Longimicrobium sp.]
MGRTNFIDPVALSPLVREAAEGRLPAWTKAKPTRREHMARVAGLMRAWASALGLPADQVARWSAAGYLHDALRDAPADELRPHVPADFRELPGKLLHGPAAAARLEGQADDELLDAIRCHTLGCPRFGTLGRALYLADFLEPGRTFLPGWTESLRRRMPDEMDAVLREVVDARIGHVEENGGILHPETKAFHAQVQAEAR